MSREGAADTKYRMSAYYYSFRPTGVPEIDNILNAIAWAGKAFHHTEHWTEEISPYPECEGESCCDWIQNAADKAAKALDAAYAEGLREAATVREWTSENPTKPGWYWMRRLDIKSQPCGICQIRCWPSHSEVYFSDRWESLSSIQAKCEWAGPLPAPVERLVQGKETDAQGTR